MMMAMAWAMASNLLKTTNIGLLSPIGLYSPVVAHIMHADQYEYTTVYKSSTIAQFIFSDQ